ncbi:MAG: ribonuclease H-like domain-containing protein, partial [Eubacterium sp.]|nr:ribonuclease H-like domain-containing protein [Eubacterium sp.]
EAPVCFFDIETTGLSPAISNVYLIGAAVISDDAVILTQWFADDYDSEKKLLMAFADELMSSKTVIHYNGSTFDIPYLEKKYIAHELPSPFINTESFDIYRRLSSKKQLFNTPDHKLTTMERLAGFNRGFDYSGRECIDIYSEYMQSKFAHEDDRASDSRKRLLSHNSDDVVGTIYCLALMPYIKHIRGSHELRFTKNAAVFKDILPDGLYYPFPLDTEITISDHMKQKRSTENIPGEAFEHEYTMTVSYRDNYVLVNVPLIDDTLYHFFPDHKNYYYLPDEDMAIHKSVGEFVDKAHRRQASASDCYIKKSGLFMPLPKNAPIPGNALVYKYKHAPKGVSYIEAHSASAEDMISFVL